MVDSDNQSESTDPVDEEPPPMLPHDQQIKEKTLAHEKAMVQNYAYDELFRFYKFISKEHLSPRGAVARNVAKKLELATFGTDEFDTYWDYMKGTIQAAIESKRTTTTQGLKKRVVGKF
jgi:hypothetical protein